MAKLPAVVHTETTQDAVDPRTETINPEQDETEDIKPLPTVDGESAPPPGAPVEPETETEPAPESAPSLTPSHTSDHDSVSSKESGEASEADDDDHGESADATTSAETSAPPLPSEPLPGAAAAPPLPEDDGWDFHWNPNDSSFWFYNRFTGVWQKDNPRVPTAAAAAAASATPATAVIPETADKTTMSNPESVAGGYNPAIHGSYDENAWYAQNARAAAAQEAAAHLPPGAAAADLPNGDVAAAIFGTDPTADPAAAYAIGTFFNRVTGQWQTADQGVERHSDEAKSKRQINAFFDVDAAANMHDGRSLKAERSGKKPTKTELKAFKEKRRAKKEEKRRAWLRD
ncbi:hypothetical protein B0T17DRAFT_617716 [Bombardia bombarda]|uniref:WW domain-containing protein n=1 Tax=Bombardia bombarda TaxID=252184 RepID=A0AA40C181_9PEZI|nr:hypothetical protein B0T17DRAFT_617716 [Bombardia bombarda]